VSTWRGKGSVAKHEDPLEETESLGKGDKELAEGLAKVAIVQNGNVNGEVKV